MNTYQTCKHIKIIYINENLDVITFKTEIFPSMLLIGKYGLQHGSRSLLLSEIIHTF